MLLNFLTDFPALTLAQDSVDPEMLQWPRKWDIKFIRNFMFTFGLLSSVFDYSITFILFNIFRESQGLYQSGWFIFSILTELVTLMVMRTRKPFFKSRPATLLLISTVIVGAITLSLPYTFLAPIFALQPIPLTVIGILFVLVGFYIAAMEGVKYFFYRHNRNF